MTSLRTHWKTWLMLLPGVGTILLLMGSTFYMVVAQSFGFHNMMGESGFSTEFWRDALADPTLHKSLIYSIKVSVIGALGAVSLAYPLVLWLRKPFTGSTTITGLLRAPMFIPGLVAAFLLVNVISYHGVVNQGLMWLGITEKPIRMQNDNFGWGVIILQIWKQLPFAMILLAGAVNSIRNDVLDAASDLGANAWRRFTGIVFPLSIPALQVSLILIFIGALGDYSFYSIAGPKNTYSLSMLMHITSTEFMEWNKGAVVAVIIMVTAVIASLAISLLTAPLATKKGKLK
ncbi:MULTISPECIES: ABC transporter permease [Vibrio]|uniref:ABC transporter permease n=1 Tax=Vibrio mediterranei TaxID=689 RepID=A0A241T9H2_9VIBR|nr:MULTISPECIES: ABC transporter permease [Vibrio]ASI91979.1 spermidine/putrescine ABC transporter permease [Vibrio mediterranei]AYV23431.1 ABC transporter permease [Vibrio mediterranei]KFA98340.1 spermidine/putrescine ABC transporter permease [Vibrio sp. ER1A]MCF4172363.1 ABC transporter permease [Vibrio sp. McD22-P3]MCG9625347.1 ABC transporter permease [Vibrio mediterranei]